LTGAARAAAAAALALSSLACQAGVTRYCEAPQGQTAEEKDLLFSFAAVIKAELERSGASLALVARSGLDLSRFNVRYSHAGFSLKASPDTPWAVRQLYYACDEKVPRIYDQGLSAFLLGSHEAAVGYISVLLLPAEAAARLERAALDKRLALEVLAPIYSANAYPWSVRYQNCNQWVIELLASAFGALDETGADTPDRRARAQRWLKEKGYQPSVFDIGWRPLMWASLAIPWVHADDHPDEDYEQNLYRVSMPAAIEAFVRATVPGAVRLEFCHSGARAVVHRGWDAMAEGCQPGVGDMVVALD
jgi:hypothetical protein